jgi:tetratricopeptide (TPR) repeat protein
MRNILFIILMIVTVAFAVSCNVQNSAEKDGSAKTVSEKQEKGSVETPKIFTKIIGNDNSDIMSRLNEMQSQLNERIDGINLSIDNTQVLEKLDGLKADYDAQISALDTKLAASDAKRKEQFYQILVAILSATIAILAIMLITYRYIKKFIAESMIISSYKSGKSEPAPEIKVGESESNTVLDTVNASANALNAKIKEATFLFDPEKAVKLTGAQKTALTEINAEVSFLKKAGFELSSKHEYLTALEKVNDKNYSEASNILDKIKEDEEPYAPAFFLSGYIAYVSRKYDSAIVSLEKACALEPENAAYLVSYGNACLKEKKYEEAATALKKAVEINSDDASAWNNLAHAYIVSEKMTEAVEAFKRATEIKPDFHEALHNLGLALGKLERYEEAAEAFTKAIAAKEDKHESMYNAACVFALIGKRDGALSNLKKAIELQPEYAAKAKKDKDFSSFKDDEEFQTIVK